MKNEIITSRCFRKICKNILIKIAYNLPFLNRWFKDYRIRKNVDFWVRWIETRKKQDPSFDLATESYWQYYHDLRIKRDEFKGKRVLDIGCGPRNSLGLFDAEIRIGVDPCIDKYQVYFLDKGLEDLRKHNMIYLSSPSEDIPLPAQSIDVVICANALNHVDDPKKTISEVHRILVRNGNFHISADLGGPVKVNEPHPIMVKKLEKWLSGLFEFKLEIFESPPEGMDFSYLKFSERICSPNKPFVLVKSRKIVVG